MTRPAARRASLAIVLASSMLIGCSGSDAPEALGIADGRLATCPDRPNCVASDAADEAYRIDPFRIDGDHATAWTALQTALENLPRTRIVTAEDAYLHAEARSRIFGFVDDLEFQLKPDERQIAVRSAARTGYSDFGVNAERIETIRRQLREQGVLR